MGGGVGEGNGLPLKATSSFARQKRREGKEETEQTAAPRPHSPPRSVCCPRTVSVAEPIEKVRASEWRWGQNKTNKQKKARDNR